MRLYLHGRSQPEIILRKLQQAKLQPITSILISSWGGGRSGTTDTSDDDNSRIMAGESIAVTEKLCEYVSSKAEETNFDEITLQNCKQAKTNDDEDDDDDDDENDLLQRLVTTIVRSSPQRLNIRYDTQQSQIPKSVLNGLRHGTAAAAAASNPTTAVTRIRSLSFCGMTLTSTSIRSLQLSLSNIIGLEEVSLSCLCPLNDVDRKSVSIFGSQQQSNICDNHEQQKQREVTTDDFINLLQTINGLQTLALEQCYIQDDVMAKILSSLASRGLLSQQQQQQKKQRQVRTLKLRGNDCGRKSIQVLYSWLIQSKGKDFPASSSSFSFPSSSSSSLGCSLEYLDLSWQKQFQHSQKRPKQPTTTLSEQQQQQQQAQQVRGSLNLFRHPLSFLIDAIGINHSLKSLCLSENRLDTDHDDETIVSLIHALHTNTTLQTMELKDCRITINGMYILAENLDKFHLKYLRMNGKQHQHCADSTSISSLKESFYKSLVSNHFIHELILPNDDFDTDDIFEEMERQSSSSLTPLSLSLQRPPPRILLEWNRAGRRILQEDDEKIPLSLWPTILSRADGICRRQQNNFTRYYRRCDPKREQQRLQKRSVLLSRPKSIMTSTSLLPRPVLHTSTFSICQGQPKAPAAIMTRPIPSPPPPPGFEPINVSGTVKPASTEGAGTTSTSTIASKATDSVFVHDSNGDDDERWAARRQGASIIFHLLCKKGYKVTAVLPREKANKRTSITTTSNSSRSDAMGTTTTTTTMGNKNIIIPTSATPNVVVASLPTGIEAH